MDTPPPHVAEQGDQSDVRGSHGGGLAGASAGREETMREHT